VQLGTMETQGQEEAAQLSKSLIEDEIASAKATAFNGPTVESPRWQNTLDKVVAAVVSIKFCTVRHFDTERAGYGVATGFVVDKTRGLILTNRHVVRPGPVTAEAIFLDHEEVAIYPVYRDPVHDLDSIGSIQVM